MAKKQHKRPFRKRDQRKICTVYGLFDSGGHCRYVGQTRLTLEERLQWFSKQVQQANQAGHRLTPVERWVEVCSIKGLPIKIVAIIENATWNVTEILWIERMRIAGHDLLNVTRGGEDTIEDMAAEIGWIVAT